MSTAYSLSDQLSKDSGGQKILMPVDMSTSQLDFALLGSIGARTVASKVIGHLAVGGGVVASAIQASAVGMPVMLGYLNAPSGIAAGGFQLWRGTAQGYAYTTRASMISLVSEASTNTASAASAVVYGALIVGGSAGTIAGGCVVLLDGATSRGVAVFSAVNTQQNINFGPRGVGFGTNVRYEKRNTTADISVSLQMANDVAD